MKWDTLIVQPDFILDEQVEPLCRYFVRELERSHSQSGWNSKSAFNPYRFPATDEFWKLVRHAGNAEVLDAVIADFEVDVRLQCRKKYSVTGTHFDGQCNYVLGVVLSGEKMWSIKEVTYWDLLRHNYLPSVTHNTYSNIAHGEGLLWYDKGQLHSHAAGTLLFLPPGWYHTVVYFSDVVSFDLSLIPKRKLRGGMSPYSIPFLYGSRGKEHGPDHTGPVHWALRHGLHALTNVLRLGMFPAYFAQSLASRFVTPGRVARATHRFAPVPASADGSSSLRQIDQDNLAILEGFLRARSEAKSRNSNHRASPASPVSQVA